MQIKLHWYEPIELGSSGMLKDTLNSFDLSTLPKIPALYIFYREKRSGGQEALYIGQTTNLRKRFKEHCNNLKLVDGLENSRQGKKMFVFAEVKVKNPEKLRYALRQAERGYIQEYYPLLNEQRLEDKLDQIISIGDEHLSITKDDIYVFSRV